MHIYIYIHTHICIYIYLEHNKHGRRYVIKMSESKIQHSYISAYLHGTTAAVDATVKCAYFGQIDLVKAFAVLFRNFELACVGPYTPMYVCVCVSE